ncbi:hypothetical protein HYH02_000035 [Chlamydomonas schloesseri]|uniref:Uncharacterized protein n=1 Tax=Chlamydomonas schloesseri TaxID=2026947 RepID=A0A836B7E7_9CHLO|nr:hypothetical protein HYH02_000035 [Chlamydomonas schloesseri]|eukprot:KAG2449931.1 hypothetical protein HYH02_000035 [Chlamydomonas schloesseri]
MLAEAEEFAVHMTGFKNSLRRYQAAVQVFLEGLPVVARGNLPRVWERVEGGLCEPLRPNVSHSHPTRVGGEFDEGLLRDARDMLDAELSHNVLRPIDRWLESLAVVRTRMRKLEGLRLQVDARRRRVHRRYMRALGRMERRGGGSPFGAGAVAGGGGAGGMGGSRRSRSAEPGRRRGYGHGGRRGRDDEAAVDDDEELEGGGTSSSPSSSDGEYEMSYGPRGSHEDEVRAVRGKEDFMRSALYYQRKLEAVQSTYREQEDLVWQHLSGLVRDAAWLKAFVAGAMLSVKDALQATAIALGPCKLPLPAFPRFNAGGEYGAIGDPSPLIADVPDVLKSAAAATAAASPLAALVGGGAGSTTGGGGGVVSRLDAREVSAALRPKRITAQPLQTAADHTTPRYGPVPPVVRGSPGVPLDELAAQEAAAAAAGGAAAPVTGSTTAALPPAGASAHGGGVIGALKELASEVTAAAKARPLPPSSSSAATGATAGTAVY